jgi:hypothetical protein
MKHSSLSFRVVAFFSMLLCAFHSSAQASNVFAHLPQTEEKGSHCIGNYANGMSYEIVSTDVCKRGTFIQLNCIEDEISCTSPACVLMHHALFYGQDFKSRQMISAQLNKQGLDVDPESYIKLSPHAAVLQLSVLHDDLCDIKQYLAFLQEVSLGSSPGDEGIELARSRLLANPDYSPDFQAEVNKVTPQEVKDLHKQLYDPKNLNLSISTSANPSKVLSEIEYSFDSKIVSCEALPCFSGEPEDLSQVVLPNLIDSVEWTPEGKYIIVDGKIWMTEPNWINHSKNGRTLGAVLTVLGIGGMILAFPYTVPIAVIAGGLSTGTGLYFLTADYLKDPYFIESARRTDLRDGCAYAYKKGRAGITLTPYERRAVFLQEMVDRPQTLSKRPILLLADLYQLNDPIVAEIFTVDEFNVLTTLKRDFIRQRNEFKILKENLQQQLAAMTAPYATVRDASLLQARDVFNQNYFVVSKEAFKLQRDASIQSIDHAFEIGEITLDEKSSLIDEAHAYYDACLMQPEFMAGLNAAELHLAQAELEIRMTYDYQVQLVKQSLQYDQWMAYYQNGEQSAVNYFDQQLHDLLATFPVYWTIFPDFLDIRGL